MRSAMNVIQLASNIIENEKLHQSTDIIITDDSNYTSNSIETVENEANFHEHLFDHSTFGDFDDTNSNDLGEDNFFSYEFFPLHPATSCSVSDAMLMIHAYSVRHDLSWTAIEDLIRLLNRVIGENKIPSSKFLFKRKFSKSIKSDPIKHFVCQECKLYLGTLEEITEADNKYCPNCQCKVQTDTKYAKNHFVTIPVREQLKNILERNSDNMVFNAHRSRTHIRDVHDAHLFQCLHDYAENIITLTFSTDGAVVFKATHEKSLWPLQFIVNEIDLEHRFQRENIFCSAISFGATPNMQTFMKPFIEEIMQINAEGGLSFKMKCGELKTCKIFPMIFTGDALAKQYVLNKVSLNGYLGCPYCLHAGTLVNRHVRYCNRNNAPMRTNEQTRADMIEAQTSGMRTNGYYGVSPLMAFDNFDVVKQVAIDKMHNIDMGIAKKLFNLFLDGENRKEK